MNWCPGLGTVLANEEVTADGRSERGNFPVFQRNLRQWNMRITAYADRLADDLDAHRLAREGHARCSATGSAGPRARACTSTVHRRPTSVEVFTTRPDTLFGATFMVRRARAPAARRGARGLARRHARRLDRRARVPRSRPSPRTGARRPRRPPSSARPTPAARPACSPATSRSTRSTASCIPVFTADYVLMGYGTGAIMAVPGRRRARLRVRRGLRAARRPHRRRRPRARRAAPAPATARSINSVERRDQPRRPGRRRPPRRAIIDWLAAQGARRAAPITYRLRDWLFSRQRYWGEPFPIVYDEHDLPIALPDVGAARRPARRARTTRRAPSTPDDAQSSPEPPLGRNDGLGERHARPRRRPADVPPRHQHDAQLGRARAGTTCTTSTRRRRRAWSSTPRSSSTGWARATTRSRRLRRRRRPVRRRRRARRAAPAVRAVLAQGAATTWATCRSARAVPHAVQPGLHPGVRVHRRARRVRPGRRGRRGRRRRRPGSPGRASRSTASTGRSASR